MMEKNVIIYNQIINLILYRFSFGKSLPYFFIGFIYTHNLLQQPAHNNHIRKLPLIAKRFLLQSFASKPEPLVQSDRPDIRSRYLALDPDQSLTSGSLQEMLQGDFSDSLSPEFRFKVEKECSGMRDLGLWGIVDKSGRANNPIIFQDTQHCGFPGPGFFPECPGRSGRYRGYEIEIAGDFRIIDQFVEPGDIGFSCRQEPDLPVHGTGLHTLW
jgi:hypothetical protein